MNESFLNLELEKRKRILQAAYEEFTENTYNNASTNRIVKKAGIGKGMLFYYFGSKEELYHYLINYGLDFVQERYLGDIVDTTGDFIERCKLMTQLKMKAYVEAPYLLEFFAQLYLKGELAELPADLEEKTSYVKQLSYHRLYNNLDYSLFRSDTPPEETIKMIQWIFIGYEKDLTIKLKEAELSYENMLTSIDEFEIFLEMVKRIFYK